VYAKTLKVDQELAEKQRTFIKDRSALTILDEVIAIEAAKVDSIMKKKVEGWRSADSVVYATGLVKTAKIVTGDEHFKSFENVIFIK